LICRQTLAQITTVVAINCATPNQTTRKYVIVLTAYFRPMVSRAQVKANVFLVAEISFCNLRVIFFWMLVAYDEFFFQTRTTTSFTQRAKL